MGPSMPPLRKNGGFSNRPLLQSRFPAAVARLLRSKKRNCRNLQRYVDGKGPARGGSVAQIVGGSATDAGVEETAPSEQGADSERVSSTIVRSIVLDRA